MSAIKNKVQLITYPDSMGGDLKTLEFVLEKHFNGLFEGGIHILPPFPSTGDRGFAPVSYFEIEPAFGDWNDVKKLSQKFDLMLDLMVNHISQNSVYVKDFLDHGYASAFSDLFIPLEKVWEDGLSKNEDIEKIFLRRQKPFSKYKLKTTGEEIHLWTTFGKTDPSEQVDMDVQSPVAKQLFREIFRHFASMGVRYIRLDAVGYIIKKAGTSCFFVEPEIYDFLTWIRQLADNLGIVLLPEVHAHHSIQQKLSAKTFWIYDFILPYMILESYILKDGKRLAEYLLNRPANQFTMLDCHDGIPVKPDLDGLVSTEDARVVVDHCVKRGANLSKVFSEKHQSEDGFDVHQIRCTYFSAMDGNVRAYLTARALQFFIPGIPQVYYVGLMGGLNDTDCVAKTGEGREINRHNYSLEEIKTGVNSDVVMGLMKLIRFRNEYPAFDGSFSMQVDDGSFLELSWKAEPHFACSLRVDFSRFDHEIRYLDEDQTWCTLEI